MENSCITLFSGNNSDKPLTVADIENNKKLKHLILHESIHAIFRRTKKECQEFGIEDGTGTLEFYSNGQELGRGFNEGLTEWICQKAGYGESSYISENRIIKILELAIGEEAVMEFASKLSLRFKYEIYPELLEQHQKAFIEQWRNSRQAENEQQKRVDLPVPYKKSWFQKLKEAIKKKFKKDSQNIRYDNTKNQQKDDNQQRFKEYISDMSNYSAKSSETNKTTQLAEQKQTNELDL